MLILVRRFAQVLSASLVLTSILASNAGAQQIGMMQERMRPMFPRLELGTRQLAGKAAIDRLGPRLGEVAGWYGKSADALRRQLLSDSDVRIDNKGRMFVVEEMPAPLAVTATLRQQAVVAGQLAPMDQTFRLHSRPTAKRTIYLDFDGATLTGTAWNSYGNTIVAKAFDFDGNPSSFSAAELQRIQFIWQRVAEDYAPFDVDVTTEAPPPDRLDRTSTTDQVFGTTVLITDNRGVYNCTCGGIAYVGVFNDTSSVYKPALVFYNMLGNGDEKAVAEAISHEAGHNIGLSHDGTTESPYYIGQGDDPVTGWAPIMGVGYYKPVVQFSRGEYAGASNKEDDFAVAQANGLPLRADDYGNTTSTAKALPSSSMIDGVIERASDVDMFAFNAAPGAFSVSITPAKRSADADLMLTLVDRLGKVLASSNPGNALDATLTYEITAVGTYYIRVRGTGLGNPLATGYTSYGSVGNYRIGARFTSAGAAPKAVITASATRAYAPGKIRLDASKSTDSDGTVKRYYWNFGDGTVDYTGTLKTATKTYSKPGTYKVRLNIVDNAGLKSAAWTTITVVAPRLSVASNALTIGPTTAQGVVTVADQYGKVVPGVAVSVSWGGIVTGTATLTTDSYGKVIATSPPTRARGCYSLTITKLYRAGYTTVSSTLGTKQICR